MAGECEKIEKGTRVVGNNRVRVTATLKYHYEKGKSIRELAEETGRSYGFVHRALTESGAALRSRGGSKRGSSRAKRLDGAGGE